MRCRSSTVRVILGGLPWLGTYVFSTRRDRPVSGLSKAKRRLDEAAEIEG